ncbi:SDR family NAD(P)-dependent oxidoreductase [Marinoscillum pacificum]|uniref:SDR family NAD(P)-dependent oxidoreductase n=1 Tax=Marinoscillum pacificum TaxID=392723 RepID=UPI0021572404|nr:SDR family oxidoreductase [Marinoscillum pacificum]
MIKKIIKKILAKYIVIHKVSVPYDIRIEDKQNEFSGDVAIVTGGSGAIGRAVACHLGAMGVHVYVCGTTIEKTNLVTQEIQALGGKASNYVLDATNPESIKDLFNQVLEQESKLDYLINCLGGSARGKSAPIFEQEISVINDILDVNLKGAIFSCREASIVMKNQGKGIIVNVSSIIGDHGKENFSEYSASKAGLISFTKSIAMDLGKYGVRVNCVSPGIVQRGQITERDLQRIKKSNYLNDFCKPEDIADSILFLLSSKARFITGQNIVVDGGRSLGLKGD